VPSVVSKIETTGTPRSWGVLAPDEPVSHRRLTVRAKTHENCVHCASWVVAQFESIPTKSAIVQGEEASPASIAGVTLIVE
jgi:hypothetical protein